MSLALPAHVAGLPMTTHRDHERVIARADFVFARLEHELKLLDEIRRTQDRITAINQRRRKGDR